MIRFRRFAAAIVLAALGLSVIAGERHFTRNDSQAIAVVRVPLNSESPRQKKLGALRYLGGWALKGANSDFGGFSALSRFPDGRFLAISDSGYMAGFRLIEDGPGSIDDAFLAPLPGAYGLDENGEERGFEDRDSESITSDPDRRRYWIGYENNAAIRRFGADFARVSAIARPKAMADWPANGGAEALVRLSDGRFLVFSESQDLDGGGTEALIFSGDPTLEGVRVDRFAYLAPDGYRITDAAVLDKDRLLILNRRISFPDGFSAVLTIADIGEIGPGQVLRPRVVARFAPPIISDNYEALLVEKTAEGPIVWIMSDDNHFILQRTLLLKFAFEEAGQSVPGKPLKEPAEPAPGFITQ